MIYTSSELIAAIKRNASIPSSQVKFTSTDFLSFLNEELQLTMVGTLLELRQDYFVTTSDTPLLPNTSTYSIPSAAVGWKLEAVGYVDQNSKYTKLPLVTRDQRDNFTSMSSSGSPSAFYINGESINLIPEVDGAVIGSIRFDLVRIQNELVLPSVCGKVLSVVDTGTAYQINVDTAPIATTQRCDVISGTNPFNIIARSLPATVVGTLVTVTYGTDFSRAPVIGDYVTATGKTPIANIPEDFHPILAQMAVIRCLASTNDVAGMQAQGVVLTNMLSVMNKRSAKRITDSPRKIVSNNYVLNMMRRR